MIDRYSVTSVTKNYRIWRTAGLALFLAAFSAGCVTAEPLKAAPGVALATLTVAEARRAPPASPETVRWGGTIVGITNTANDTTQVEIVARPLRSSGRPINDDRSDGRFIAEFKQFLDPEIYTAGRDLSVIGTVADTVEGRIGETRYRFPLLHVSDHRYWKPLPPQRAFSHSPVHDHYHYDPFWHDRYHHDGLYGRIILHP